MDKKKILIIGSGGREHALAWKIAQSTRVEKIYVVPGNGGTAEFCENISIGVMEFEKIVTFAKENFVDLVVVAPDDPLAAGLVDKLEEAGIKAWGASKKATQVEASKVFAKNLMAKYKIPTANFKTFTDYQSAKQYIEEKGAPIVIKASGLALGKGVVVCQTLEEAKGALKQAMVDKVFGEAGSEVVVEEFLQGPEISIHVFSDGNSYKIFPSSQDHKQIFDNDKGPNTGGMGTIAPVPWVDEKLVSEITETIVSPTLSGLKSENAEFKGLLYPGLMITEDGPKVIEFNARFGDPETQVYMRLLKTDLVDILEASLEGRLSEINIEWHSGFAACVILASKGYPGNYEKGKEIFGISEAEKNSEVVVFHAGTKIEDGKLLTSGGRVLGVTAIGNTLEHALQKAYEAVNKINFEGMQYRTDIGRRKIND